MFMPQNVMQPYKGMKYIHTYMDKLENYYTKWEDKPKRLHIVSFIRNV